MTDDWKGEHLIRAKLTDAEAKSEAGRLSNALAKIKGTFSPPTLSQRRAHGRFVNSSWRSLPK